MIAERLRKSILQAAIQGKLTEQLPEDGDARDLLAEIKAEKARLIREGKIKKEKPLPDITEDEIPFEIPTNWCWVRLGQVGFAQTGTTPSTAHPEYYGGDMPFIKPPYIYNDRIDYLAEGLSNEGVLKARLIPPNSILMVCIGGSTGKTFYSDRYVCCNQQINTITSYGGIETTYLLSVLQSQFFQEQLWGLATGTATTIVNKENWRQLLIPIPPTAVQRRIVDIIEGFNPHVLALKQDEVLLDSLQQSFPKKMKYSLLQAAIQGKLTKQLESDGDARDLLKDIRREKERLIKEGKIKKEKPLPEITDDEIPFDIPENWCWVRLGELASVISKGTTPTGGKNAYKRSGIGFIRGENVGADGNVKTNNLMYIDNITHFSSLKRSILEKEDLLICIAGTLGRSAVVNAKLLPLNANQAVSFVRLASRELISVYYLQKAISSVSMQKYLLHQTKVTAIPNLTLEIINNCIIPLPPLAEQHRIVERLNQLLPLCGALE